MQARDGITRSVSILLLTFTTTKGELQADVLLPWPNPLHVPLNVMLRTPLCRDKKTEGQTGKITCPKSSGIEVVELITEHS